MYLLPEAVQSHESVVLLAELERHLQLGQFSAYWTKSKLPAARTLLDRVANINDSIREFVAVVVARTYQKIGANVLAQELDLVSYIGDRGAAPEAVCAAWGHPRVLYIHHV